MNKLHRFYYLSGFLTAVFIFLLFSLFVGYKIGFSSIFYRLKTMLFPNQPYYEKILDMPGPILKELTDLKAVIEYAGDPIKNPAHDTILVKPDKEMMKVLKPGAKISAHVLKTKPHREFFTFYCPPVLYLDAESVPSERLAAYIRDNSRVGYSYSTDENGFRTTLPQINSENKILVIGDSVAFGAGVDDEFTIASFLQKAVGNKYRVVNAGVGDYSWKEALLAAKKESLKNKYACLIYVACQNNFAGENAKIDDIFNEIKSIEKNFNGNIIIFFHTYMQYTLRDLFPVNMSWPPEEINNTRFLGEKTLEASRRLNFKYCAWEDIVNKFEKQEGSLFSRFALYADHCHLSALGNRLASDEIYRSLEDLKLVN